MENFVLGYDENFGIDKKGNIYIGGYTLPGYEPSVAVITKEAKQEEIPYAKHYNFVYGSLPDCVIVDENDDAWIFTTDIKQTSQLFKITNENIAEVFQDDRYETHIGKAVKNRIYVASLTLYADNAQIYFLTLDGKVHRIQNLDAVPTRTLSTISIVADKDGSTFIGTYYASEKGSLTLIKPDGENATWIDFSGVVKIRNMIVDEKGDLWVVTDGQGIYSVKKGENAAVKVLSQYDVDINLTGAIKVNKKTNEVFVLGNSGLYFVSADSV